MIGLLSSLSFGTPWALAALALLPVIWWLLRFTPPQPKIIAFPPVRLLLDLVNQRTTPDKTPWWLLFLRLAAAVCVILGVSHPLLQPDASPALQGPLLLVIDDGWAASADWPRRRDIADRLLDQARQQSKPVALAFTTRRLRAQDLAVVDADTAKRLLAAHEPQALNTERDGLLEQLRTGYGSAPALSVIWIADGIGQNQATRFATGLVELAQSRAQVQAYLPDLKNLASALAPPQDQNGQIKIQVYRPSTASPPETDLIARAADGRELSRTKIAFAATALQTEASFDLPIEIRNAIQRFTLSGQPNAAATYLMDDHWRRKSVVLIAGQSLEENQPLLSPLYYISRALEPYAELTQPQSMLALKQQLESGVSVLVLADVGHLPPDAEEAVKAWIERGGLLLRFAGARLGEGDTLLPVTLRGSGRELGSAMSWAQAQTLGSFAPHSPFAALVPDPKITVARQVLAEPDADLPPKVWATLADGTPLVTAAPLGKGLIVLFHVTAAPDWSSLPLSGQFVDMLHRLLERAPPAGGGQGAASTVAEENAPFELRLILRGDGELTEPPPDIRPLSRRDFATATASPETPAGLYARGEQVRAINLDTRPEDVTAITQLPAGIAVQAMELPAQQAMSRLFFLLAFGLFVIDSLIAILRVQKARHMGACMACIVGVFMLLTMTSSLLGSKVQAQGGLDALQKAATTLHLAYVKTGDKETDDTSRAGLAGLTEAITARTSVTVDEPQPVDIEADEIVFYPLLYWPVLADAATPSSQALEKLSNYMKNGGTIFFDMRDGGLETDGAVQQALRRITGRLPVPPLETVPSDHVLTKSFYLLQEFPGRYADGKLWTEQAEEGASSQVDGVSSILIGSNDYAAAWAVDERGEPLYAVIPPDERQREMAYRTGINIVMYVLTGNYKADQVHVPALLERLGQ